MATIGLDALQGMAEIFRIVPLTITTGITGFGTITDICPLTAYAPEEAEPDETEYNTITTSDPTQSYRTTSVVNVTDLASGTSVESSTSVDQMTLTFPFTVALKATLKALKDAATPVMIIVPSGNTLNGTLTDSGTREEYTVLSGIVKSLTTTEIENVSGLEMVIEGGTTYTPGASGAFGDFNTAACGATAGLLKPVGSRASGSYVAGEKMWLQIPDVLAAEYDDAISGNIITFS